MLVYNGKDKEQSHKSESQGCACGLYVGTVLVFYDVISFNITRRY